MKMIQNGLTPGMKHTYKSRVALESPLGIGGKLFDGQVDRGEQKVQQRSHIAQGDWVQIVGQREYKMVIGCRQELGLPTDQPALFGHGLALGAMPVPAGVIGILLVIAAGTKINMASQGCRPADHNSVQNFYLFV